MSDLADLTDSLRRTVARPGEFARFFPNTTDDDLTGTLLDGFSEAQLDGFFVQPTLYEADESGTVTPDLSRPAGALVLLYAGVRFIRAELLNRKNRTRYVARGNEAETEQSASILTTLLKEAEARKASILEVQRLGSTASAFIMADLYVVKALGYVPVGDLLLAGQAVMDPLLGVPWLFGPGGP